MGVRRGGQEWAHASPLADKNSVFFFRKIVSLRCFFKGKKYALAPHPEKFALPWKKKSEDAHGWLRDQSQLGTGYMGKPLKTSCLACTPHDEKYDL